MEFTNAVGKNIVSLLMSLLEIFYARKIVTSFCLLFLAEFPLCSTAPLS